MALEETENTPEEIVEMIKQGDLSLAPKLYEQTKAIISFVIWREWRRDHIRSGAAARGMEIDDLLQEGYFMMIEAARHYDGSLGTKFSTYLYARVRASVKTITARRKIDETVSIYEPFDADDADRALEDVIADPSAGRDFDEIEDRDYCERLRSDLEDSIRELPDDQATVIRGKYLERRLVKDLAEDLKIAEGRVGIIEERALHELRKSERLQLYREDIITRYSLRGTLSAFKNTGMSAVELAVIKLDDLERKELKRLERKEWDAAAHRQKRAAWANMILNTKERETHG